MNTCLVIKHGVLILTAGLLLSACASFNSSIAGLADTLNERQLKSCFKWQTYLRGMDIAGGQASGVSVTGGADMKACQGFLKGQAF